jgi:hypothetical protein
MLDSEHIAAYRHVVKWWLCKQRPFLDNGKVNTLQMLDSRFLITQQLDYNGNGMFQLSSAREAEPG